MHNLLKKNKDGTVLFMVVSIMMVLIVVMMSALVIVTAAQKKAVENYTESQSYITARNVVDTYITALSAVGESAYAPLRTYLTDTMSPGSTEDISVVLPASVAGLGTLDKLTVTKLDDANYKISATVTDNFSTNTVSQNITITTSDGIGLFNKAITSLGSCDLNAGQSKVLGGYINFDSNPVMLDADTEIYGCFHNTGSIIATQNKFYLSQTTITPGGTPTYVPDSLESAGDITLSSAGTRVFNNSAVGVTPYILTSGTLNLAGDGSGIIIGEPGKHVNIYAGVITGSNVTIYGDIYCAGNITLGAESYVIEGTIHCGGSVTIDGAALVPDSYNASAVPALNEYDRDAYKSVDELIRDSGLDFSSTDTLDIPLYTNDADFDIDESCTINGNIGERCTLTITVDDEDICIVTPNEWKIGNYSNIYINNTETDVNNRGNVYFYTMDAENINLTNATIGIDPTNYLGDTHLYGDNYLASNNTDAEEPGNFYWLMGGNRPNRTLLIEGNDTTIKGYIYAPGVTYEYYNGGELTSAKFDGLDIPNVQPAIIGAIIGNNAAIQNNMGPLYVRPGKSIFTDLSPSTSGGFRLTKKHYSNK